MYKRLFDIAFSLLVLTLGLPLLIPIALLIKSTSRGPIFYRGLRVGKGGELFTCWKFRTMHLGAKRKLSSLLARDPHLNREWTTYQKLRNDPRVTKVGKFLRLFSIDELPQFWNVLTGDLSVVGPRPVEIYQKDRLSQELQKRFADKTQKILSVKPGITCLWQIRGRSLLTARRQIEFEEEYVDRQSFALDLKIICKTAAVVLFPKGAY